MIGILTPAVCVVSSDPLYVAGDDDSTIPYALLEPSINRGGIGVDDGGTWRLVAPRSGLYRVTIQRAQVSPREDDGGSPGQPVGAEFHASASLGDAFVDLSSPPFGLGGGGSTGFEYVVMSASAVMVLDAGQELVPEFAGSGPAATDPAVGWIETFGTFAVELLRRV